jgi:hypothetical protein
MKAKIISLVMLFVLSGCARTYWVHPSKSSNQLQGDVATCQNEAMRSMPNVIAAPVAPVYVPPTQYSTNCSTMGIYTNCNTTAQPDNMARVMQQNAQNMAQAGSNIGTALSRKSYTENCLTAYGWSKQKESVQSNIGSRSPPSEFQKKGWIELIAKRNGCEGVAHVSVKGTEGIRETFEAVCDNKKYEISCEFDGPINTELGGIPFVAVSGKSYTSKPACWR